MLFVLISPPDFIKKRTVSFSAQEAAKARLSQYRTAGDFFWENPVFGIGMGMEGKRVEANRIRTQWAAVENVYLTLLVSHGLVGLAAFLLVLIYFWGMLCFARAGSKDDPFIRYTSEALILGMVGIAVSSMFGAWLIFAIPMYTMFCFFLGFGASSTASTGGSIRARARAANRLPSLCHPMRKMGAKARGTSGDMITYYKKDHCEPVRGFSLQSGAAMRVVICGASGQLGSELRAVYGARGDEVLAFDMDLDITLYDVVMERIPAPRSGPADQFRRPRGGRRGGERPGTLLPGQLHRHPRTWPWPARRSGCPWSS